MDWIKFWEEVDAYRALQGLKPLWDDVKQKWTERLAKLNPSQLKAVTTVNATVQITSVAGSGKTTVMVNRIGYMIECLGIDPASILATTFTKKATEELKTRLSAIISKEALGKLMVGSTHSIAYRILAQVYRANSHHLAVVFNNKKGETGKTKKAVTGEIIQGWKQAQMMKDCKNSLLKSQGLDDDQRQRLERTKIPEFIKTISLAKNLGISVHQYTLMHSANPVMAHYVDMYQMYENAKNQAQCMDLDDLIFNLVEVLETDLNVRKAYQSRYKYIMVDESQDNNILQWKLSVLLAYPEMNSEVVGDDDQSMYRFRGAKPEMFIEYAKFVNQYLKELGYNKTVEVQQIPLENNYRSYPDILDRANRLIAHNTFRIPKQLVAHKQHEGRAVHFKEYRDEVEEAVGVVEEVQLLNQQQGVELKDQVILYRTNKQCVAFENELIIRSVPYVIHGGLSFYERKEVKQFVSYLKLALDYYDNKAFLYVYNAPNFEDQTDPRNRFLGNEFVNACKDAVKSVRKKSYYLGMDNIKHEKAWVLENWKKGIKKFKDAVEGLKAIVEDESKTTDDAIDFLLEEAGFEEHFKEQSDDEADDEENTALANIDVLRHAMSRFDSVKDFLDYIDQMTSNRKEDINGVQLMTIHKSKGLEFKVVFMVGLSEGMLPHYKVIEEGDFAVESERNLAYVTVTRGEQIVNVSAVHYFNDRPYGISRFVYEMGLVEDENGEDADIGYGTTYIHCTECMEQYDRTAKLASDEPDTVHDGICKDCKNDNEFDELIHQEIRETSRLVRDAIHND